MQRIAYSRQLLAEAMAGVGAAAACGGVDSGPREVITGHRTQGVTVIMMKQK